MSRLSIALVALAALSTPALAQSWGDLTLRVVFDGDKPPVPGPVAAAAGIPFCGGAGVKDDSLLVNAKDHGVANVFVYLFEPDASKVPVHASFAAAAKDQVKMANKGCAFVPKAVALRTTQKLIGQNPDPVGHNMKFDPFENVGFNLAIPSGGQITPVFAKAEKTPLERSCTSHPWMKGLVLIREDPYFALSDASGRVIIANLPVGKWAFRVWQERNGFVSKGTLGGKAVEWPRGRITWEIKPGENNLGELLIKPEAFR